MKPKILITNDDGINAPGIKALYQTLKGDYDCWIVAPATEQSACSHSITITRPVEVSENHNEGQMFSCSGTPVDCVKIGVKAIMNGQPEVIISGINAGLNTGRNILYSGTVAAALEGAYLGLKSIAVSVDTLTTPDFYAASGHFKFFLRNVIEYPDIPGVVLNLNYPSRVSKDSPMVLTEMGRSVYDEAIIPVHSGSDQKKFLIQGTRVIIKEAEQVDQQAVNDNKISLTPLRDYTTCPLATKDLSRWQYFN